MYRQNQQKFAVTIVIVLLIVLISPWNIHVEAQSADLKAIFDYSMPPRFGMDKDGDGLIDYYKLVGIDRNEDGKIDSYATNTNINPDRWTVNFDACASTGSPSEFNWSVTGAPGAITSRQFAKCDGFSYGFDDEGTYQVTLEVWDSERNSERTTQTVIVQDWLIIGLGDSIGSGEGNPDIPAFPGKPAVWQDEDCHRSAFSGQAQAAKKLEDADKHTSVTFVHLACSGNIIKDLTKKDGQLDAIYRIIGEDHVVDAVIISIGANDIHFSDIVKACMYQAECHNSARVDPFPLATIACGKLKDNNSFEDYLECLDFLGVAPEQSAAEIFEEGISTLEGSYQTLHQQLEEKLKASYSPNRIFITEYPDMTRNQFGDVCGNLPTDISLPGWIPDESKWASDTVLPKLNKEIENAASKFGWKYVSGIANNFRTHGYCAGTVSPPGTVPPWSRWVNTLDESFLFQGDQNGVVHPNKDGHLAYANAIYSSLQDELYVAGDLSRPKQIPLAIIPPGLIYVDEGSSVVIENETIDPNGDVRYRWSLSNSDAASLSSRTTKNPMLTGIDDDDSKGYTLITLTLVATNSSGMYEAKRLVEVSNVAPTASLTNNGPTDEGSPTTISMTDAKDRSPADTQAGFHYAFACNGNSLAGATYAGSGTDASFVCTFTDNGSHLVRGKIIDKDEGATEYTTTVTVNNVAPTVDAGADQRVNEGDSVTLKGTYDDPGKADKQAFRWHLMNSTNGQAISDKTTQDFSFAPIDNGVYTFEFKAVDDDGGEGTDTVQVTVNNVAPTIALSGAASVNEGASYTLNLGEVKDPAKDKDKVTEYIVNWGDGSSNTYTTDGAVTHAYTDGPASQTITVDLVDEDGTHKGAGNKVVTVNNVAPSANAGADQQVREGSPVSLSGTFTDDGADQHTVQWRLVSSSNAQTVPDATSQTLDFTPTDNGIYVFEFVVTDDDGGTNKDTVTVTVDNVDPTASQPANVSTDEGSPTTISLTGANDPSQADTQAGFHYAFDCNGNSLAGATYAGSGTAASVDCTFTDDGSYLVRGKIIDKNGGYAEYETTVVVNNVAPTANPVVDGDLVEGNPIQLNGAFDDPGADGHSFEWKFVGSSNGQELPGTANQNLTFTPIDNGSYTFEFEVTDDDGGRSGVETVEVTIENAAPVITANNATINENDVARISGSIIEPGALDSFSLEVDWGEGDVESVPLPAGTTEYSISHQYLDDNPSRSQSDDYAVRVSLKDKDGGEGLASPTVTVQNLNPKAEFKAFKDQSGRVLGLYEIIPVNTTLTVIEQYSDRGLSDTRTAVRNWGDGWVVELGTVEDTTSASHTYTKAGYYQLVLTVTDDDGGVTIIKRTIHVVPPSGAISNTVNGYIPINGTNGKAMPAIDAALTALAGEHGALIKIERGNRYGALLSIKQAMHELKSAQNKDQQADLTSPQIQLALTAQSILIEAISQAEANARNQNYRNKIEEAKSLLKEGQILIQSGNYLGAVDRFKRAMNKIK